MYIEREALLNLKEEMWQDRCDHMVVRVTNIMNVPAADVAPVVSSQWEITDIDHAYGTKCYHCPECGEDEWRYDESNYCPNCGAKMDGGTHEQEA